jgi:probable HAF family extracellular repeat protein
LTNLGHLPDGTGAATAINECGDIVGFGIAVQPGGSTITRAIVWIGGPMQVLEPLPGFKRSAANDINDDGIVVGQCWGTAASINASTAFVWHDGVMRDLNELLLPGSGLELQLAQAIDADGRITGYARDSENDNVAVRLTPVKPALGDLDCDGSVNASDLAILLGGWNLPGAGDLDRDGAVGPPDIALGEWIEPARRVDELSRWMVPAAGHLGPSITRWSIRRPRHGTRRRRQRCRPPSPDRSTPIDQSGNSA